MASLDGWLSPAVMQALGWALIHSLWQCAGVAALAASLMALSRRASVRYLVGVGALALMLAAPIATFFLLMKPDAPVQNFPSAISAVSVPSVSPSTSVKAVPSIAMAGAWEKLPSVASSPDLLPWLVGAWLLGVTLFGLRFAGGFLLLEHRRRRESREVRPHILAICHQLQRQLGLNHAIRFLECAWLETPAVIGWLRPVILLPVTALTGLSEDQLRAVIAHELAHIRRLDMFVNLFQILVETLLFYHPAMWWLNRRIRAEREICCDEVAVSLTGNRLEYARALALMAEWKAAPMLAMAANRAPLAQRILHVLGRSSVSAGQRMLGLAGGLLFLAASLGAADALFGIAYPIPAAQAKESFKAALSSAGESVARQVLAATVPAANAADLRIPLPEIAEPVQIAQAQERQPETPAPAPPAPAPVVVAQAVLSAPGLVTPQPAPPPPAEPRDDAVDNVIVTAPRLRPEKALDNFIIAHARQASPIAGKIARWKDGICPLTVGLSPQLNQYVNQRIIRVAMTAGAPLAQAEPCRPNLLVLATAEPQALLDEMRAKRPGLLGFHYRPRAEKLATMRLAVQAWYGTATEDFRGRLYPDSPRMALGFEGTYALPTGGLLPDGMSVTGNRTGDGLRSNFTSAIIIVDTTKIAGQEIGPISDYIAMLALSQGQYYDVCQDIPTITNLMAPGCGPEMKPAALTDIDVTYLRGLYRMSAGLSYIGQRGSIAFNMKKTLGGY
jgi:beta-lactamase regulating signal transducer with metallopeptidase domain